MFYEICLQCFHVVTYISLSRDSLIESTTHWSNSFRNLDLFDNMRLHWSCDAGKITNMRLEWVYVRILPPTHLGVMEGKSCRVLRMQPTSLKENDNMRQLQLLNISTVQAFDNFCSKWDRSGSPVCLVRRNWVVSSTDDCHDLCKQHLQSRQVKVLCTGN